MGIAFDANSHGQASSVTTLTVAHTCSGSNRALIVGVTGSTTDLITGVTYNGVSMTKVVTLTPTAGALYSYLFYLNAPASGTHNIVISGSSSGFILVAAASYTGVSQSGQPEANATNNAATSNTLTTTVTTITDNAWTVLIGSMQGGGVAAGANSTLRDSDGFGGTSGVTAVFDSNGVVHPAASHSMTATSTSSVNYAGGIIVSIAPSAALASGTASLTSVTNSTINLTVGAASGGTSPYTYQWYRSTTANFTPGGGNLLGGATSATLADSASLVANTPYYYVCRVTDNASATADSNQVAGCLLDPALIIGGIGDSIMVGYGLSAGQDPLTQFGLVIQKLFTQKSVTLSNQAITGTKTADWISGSTDLVAAKAAFATAGVTHVLVMLGANDAAAANLVSAATYKTNLSSMVNDLVTAGYKVVLNYPTYIPAGANSNATTAASVALAQSYQAQIDSLINGTTILRGDVLAFNYFIDHQSEVQGDQTHPTAVGAQSLGVMWAEASSSIPNQLFQYNQAVRRSIVF